MTDPLYLATMQELGWDPVSPFRPDFVHSVNYYDDRLLKRLGVDVRQVDPGSVTVTSRLRADGTDGYGLKYERSGLYRVANFYPLAEATVDEILAFPLPQAGRSSTRSRCWRALRRCGPWTRNTPSSAGRWRLMASSRWRSRCASMTA